MPALVCAANVAAGFERAAEHRAASPDAARRIVQALLGALDRLVPSPDNFEPDAGLPPEWFKYRPI